MDAEDRPAPRRAKIWKTTEEIHGADNHLQHISIEERIRVRMALKVMRKAYTKGSKSDRERMKMKEQAEVDTLVKGLRKVHKLVSEDEDEDHKRFFLETEPVKVKSLDEIAKDAKASFQLARDRLKVEQESKKFGVLRPICASLVADVKQEMIERLQKQRGAKQKQAETVLTEKPEFVVGSIRRSTSTRIIAGRRSSDSNEIDNNESVRPMSAGYLGSRKSFLVADPDVPLLERKNSMQHRPSSAGFNTKSALDDERILKVLRSKELQAQEKEQQLKQKISDRERTTLSRQELLALQERQRAWLVLSVTLSYMQTFHAKISDLRHQRSWLKQQTADRNAAALIHRWWIGKRMWLNIRRHPQLWRRLVSALLRYRLRLRHRKKVKSASMILNFLRDSSGLSESVRRIYSFRQSIIKIQRWVRSWCDVQIFRVRMLWVAAERVGRKIAQQQRISKLNDERTSVKALRMMTGFADTVAEIDAVKKELAKVFDYQIVARRGRDELAVQIKQLNIVLDEPMPAAAKDNGTKPSSPSCRRRAPVLMHQASMSPSLVSSGSQQDLFGDEASMAWNQQRNIKLQQFLAPVHGGGLSSSNLSSSGRSLSRSRSNYSSRPPAISVGSPDAAASHMHRQQSVGNLGASHASLGKRASFRKANKSTNRMGGYSILALGVIDRYGSSDPDLAAWLKKVRSTQMSLKLYESLRSIVQQRRKKHIAKLNAVRAKRRANPVEMTSLAAFLKNPTDNSASTALSAAINVHFKASSMPNIIADMRQYPWLLLTDGGLEAVETLLHTSKFRFM